jgi:pimeloyl-ACP methyl ester carboxylesterase
MRPVRFPVRQLLRGGRRPVRVMAVAVAASAAVAACGSPGSNPLVHTPSPSATRSATLEPDSPAAGPTSPSASPSSASPSPAGSQEPTSTPVAITWGSCGKIAGTSGSDQCATMPVPLDRADPAGQQLLLQLVRRKATSTSERVGSLLINPGGPGESTVGEFDDLYGSLSADLTSHFDVVGWDPRGVGLSAPVKCVDGPTLDRLIADSPDPTTASGLNQFVADTKTYVDGCQKNSGALLPHIGTIDSAKDMDVIRASLGDAKLSYLGFSYGTELGMTYAALFPDRVRALVLDGALDPKLDPIAGGETQADGFQNNLIAFFAYCKKLGDGCPWKTDDPKSAFDTLQAAIPGKKLTDSTGKRTLTLSLFSSGVTAALYDQSSWNLLALALQQAGTGDGRLLFELSDSLSGRASDGTYSNIDDAFTAITCVDGQWPTQVAPYVASYQRLEQRDPEIAGGYLNAVGPGYTCGTWPVKPVPVPTSVTGAPPIVIVGTSNDPATPFTEATAMQSEIAGSYLVKRDGNGHTGYSASACVRGYADRYLVNPAVLPPSKNATCTS